MKDTTRTALYRSSTASFALGIALMAAPAWAQDTSAAQTESASAQDDTAGDSGEVVVTGSRIARRDLDTAAPLAVVSAEEFKLSGTVNVEQVINTLPQVVPGTTAFSNNPGGGVATLNLRGLGSNRNLVLVNGRRWIFFDTGQVVDLNTVPSFLLESVDVVTGGASAVYGSDAIAGVVNFRLKNQKGIQIGSQYSITEKGDGARFNVNAAIGGEFADGRGHITAYGEYFKRKPIFQDARSFSRFTNIDDGAGGFVPSGSNTTPAGRFTAPGTSSFTAGGATTTLPLGQGLVFCSGTQAACGFASPGNTGSNPFGGTFSSGASAFRPYVTNNDIYNFAPANYLQVAQERFMAGAYGDYEIADGITAYMETTFINNRVPNELAATPVTGNFNVRIASVAPFLSAADVAALNTLDARETAINTARAAAGLGAMYTGANALSNGAGVVNIGINRRIIETGPRNTLDERNAFRVLGGLKGAIGDTGLSYDAYYSYARTRNANVQAGNISRRAFQAGLDGTAPAIDIFGPNTLSAASVSQISILAQNNDISTLQVANASVNGSLFNFGWGGDDIGFAVGGEWRSVSARFIPDTALSSGDVIGFNAGNPTQGSYNVKEAFAELRIPIAARQPGVYNLELTGAGRYSDYSLKAVGGVWTYAGGIEYSPIRDITFRGQYARAVRAPNVGELFGGFQQGFATVVDPCTTAAAAAAGALRNTCIATGVPAANLGGGIPSTLQPNSQIQIGAGGNPNLDAERSTSYTYGVVLRPSFIPGLSITADYFNIKISNLIFAAGGGAGGILDLCYNVFQDANNGFCQLVTRNSATGAIDGVTNPDGSVAVVFQGGANLSSLKTSGIDLQFDYNRNLGFGLLGETSRLNFFFLGTWTKNNTIRSVNGDPATDTDCAGKFGVSFCGQPQPTYKWTSRLSWIDGPLTTSLRWRHLGGATDDDPTTDYTVERLKAYNLYDLSFSVDATDNLTLAAGVNNLLNKKPTELGSNAEQANTYPGVYDVLGRDYFVSAQIRF